MGSLEVDFRLFFPPAMLAPALAIILLLVSLIWFTPGGVAWALSKAQRTIPGPVGVLVAFTGTQPHRALAGVALKLSSSPLMAFSVGMTRFVISSKPETAKEILCNPAFADRPVTDSANELLFHRAMGFAPFGEYWRNLRRISATYLFSPKLIAAAGENRRSIGAQMVSQIGACMSLSGVVEVRKVLHFGSLNNVMSTVFGKRFDFYKDSEGLELELMVREGYELLGKFNWVDHLPVLGWFDLQGVRKRCKALVKRVQVFVGKIIEEHRLKIKADVADGVGDFVDVLLGLEKEEKLSDSDMVAVLWEMIFRGTDTVAILLEWIIARMAMHPDIQSKAQEEIDLVAGNSPITDGHLPNLPYVQAIVKETLRMHPPGPLLSWARLAIHDVHVGGHLVPAGTTAMVNMWSITHDESIWSDPISFKPERFMDEDVSVLGSDLRLAPFGAGRRVCPGKALGLATVTLWLSQLLQNFKWVPTDEGVDMSECLKMSLELKNPLVCKVVPRLNDRV